MFWNRNCRFKMVINPRPECLHYTVEGRLKPLTYKTLAHMMIPSYAFPILTTSLSLYQPSPLSSTFLSSLLGGRVVINISGCVTGGPPSTSWRAELLMEFRGGRQRANRQGSMVQCLAFSNLSHITGCQ